MKNFEQLASPIEIAAEATQILLPKGSDNAKSREAFMEATGLEIPAFKGERLLAYSQGKEFALVKAAAIPALVAMRNPKLGERIGVVGSDVSIENPAPVRSARIGETALCRLSLLSSPQDREWISDRLAGDSRQLKQILRVVTAYPRLLTMAAVAKDLPIASMQFPDYAPNPLKGSGEIMPELVGVSAVADLIVTGTTAYENNKVEVMALAQIYPEMVWGNKNETIR